MKLILRILPILLVFFILIQWFVIGVAPPRQRIIDSIVGMQEGFNQQRAGDVLVHCTEDFSESTYNMDASSFRGALFRIFMGQRDKSDQSFLWRVEVQQDEVEIDPDPEGEGVNSVDVSAPVHFFRVANPGSPPVWVMRIRAQAIRQENGDWKFRSASFKTVRGRMPFCIGTVLNPT